MANPAEKLPSAVTERAQKQPRPPSRRGVLSPLAKEAFGPEPATGERAEARPMKRTFDHEPKVIIQEAVKTEARKDVAKTEELRKEITRTESPTDELQARLAEIQGQEDRVKNKIDRIKAAQSRAERFASWIGLRKDSRLTNLQAELETIEADRNTTEEDLQALKLESGYQTAQGRQRKIPLTPKKVLEHEAEAREGRMAAEKEYGKATEKTANELEREYLGEEEAEGAGIVEFPEEARKKALKEMEEEEAKSGVFEIPEARRRKILHEMEMEEIEKGWEEAGKEVAQKKKEKAEFEEAIRPRGKQVELGKKAMAEEEKRLKPMTLDRAKGLVPNADRIWDLAAAQIDKFPDAATATDRVKQFGSKGVEDHPATRYVFTLAKYLEAEQSGDKKLADARYADVVALTRAFRLDGNALIQSSLARRPGVKDVLKGTRQRQEAVRRANVRNRF